MTPPPDHLHDHLVQAERSMFGTRLPRPTGVGRHLVVVIVVSAVALGIAIYFAESGGPAPAATEASR
ncbi:MAG TPA: hypothetical protein VGF99_19815 [Myxococcota bacterium]